MILPLVFLSVGCFSHPLLKKAINIIVFKLTLACKSPSPPAILHQCVHESRMAISYHFPSVLALLTKNVLYHQNFSLCPLIPEDKERSPSLMTLRHLLILAHSSRDSHMWGGVGPPGCLGCFPTCSVCSCLQSCRQTLSSPLYSCRS